jgi:hypothetical protein
VSRGFVLGTQVTKLHPNPRRAVARRVAAMLADVILSQNVIESSAGVPHVTGGLTVDFLASADLGD